MNELQRFAAELDRIDDKKKSGTRKVQYTSKSPFSTWIRTPTELDSKKYGFRNYDVDHVWMKKERNSAGFWMRIEEKTRNGRMSPGQKDMFRHIHETTNDIVNYKGFHLLVFSNTTPDNGYTYLDGETITRKDLIEFLEFKKSDDWYETTIFGD